MTCAMDFRGMASTNGWFHAAGVALLNGIPVSAGADGCVRLWDVASAMPILTQDTPRHSRLLGLEVQPQSGYIVTCGDGVHIFDAGSAQLLHDLHVPNEIEHHVLSHARFNGGAAHSWDPDDASFRCVAYSGSVLAAGEDTILSQHPPNSCHCPPVSTERGHSHSSPNCFEGPALILVPQA